MKNILAITAVVALAGCATLETAQPIVTEAQTLGVDIVSIDADSGAPFVVSPEKYEKLSVGCRLFAHVAASTGRIETDLGEFCELGDQIALGPAK